MPKPRRVYPKIMCGAAALVQLAMPILQVELLIVPRPLAVRLAAEVVVLLVELMQLVAQLIVPILPAVPLVIVVLPLVESLRLVAQLTA